VGWDGLAEIARHRLDAGDLPQQGQEKPHLTIVVDADTLRGEPGAPPGIMDWDLPVCGDTIKRPAVRGHCPHRPGRRPR
jgi:hypothetical protein